MHKKLIALAIAGIAAPVLAQTSSVTLYGRINAGFDTYSATGATAGNTFDYKSRNRVWDQGSKIGLRGSEDLGGGLQAIFLLESGVAVDTAGLGSATAASVGQGGAGNTAAGALGSREAWGGLQGPWGNVKFGKQNVWWGTGTIDQTGANFLELQNVFVLGAHGILNAPTSRQPNTVSYTTPTMSGFNASVYYVANAETAGANVDPKDKIWDVTLRYFRGPIAAQYDWVQRYDIVSPFTGQSVSGRNNYAHKLGAAYTYMPGSQVSLIWTKIGVNNSATFTSAAGSSQTIGSAAWNVGDNLSAQSWNLEWEHTFSNIQGFAGYGLLKGVQGSSNAAGMPDTGAKTYYLGARYNFSKRTGIYVNYVQLKNDANQFVDLSAAAMSSAIATGTTAAGAPYVLPTGSPLTGGGTLGPANAGADPRAIGIGLQHNF